MRFLALSAAGAVVLVSVLGAPSAWSQEATPAAALQRASVLVTQSRALLQADLLEPDIVEPKRTAARPRHVYQFALTTFDAVQELRALNGLVSKPTPQVPPRHVTPAEVMAVLDRAIADFAELGPVYAAAMPTALPGQEAEVTPARVMARLRGLSSALEQLGIPPVLPNDVYREALALRAVLQEIAARQNIPPPGPSTDVAAKASPSDALKQLLALSRELAALSQRRPDLTPPGGTFEPPVPQEGQTVRPADVLAALKFVLADAWAIAVESGVAHALDLPPPQSGRNPADVRNTFADARQILIAISTPPSASSQER